MLAHGATDPGFLYHRFQCLPPRSGKQVSYPEDRDKSVRVR